MKQLTAPALLACALCAAAAPARAWSGGGDEAPLRLVQFEAARANPGGPLPGFAPSPPPGPVAAPAPPSGGGDFAALAEAMRATRARVDGLAGEIGATRREMVERIDNMTARLDGISRQVEGIGARLATNEKKIADISQAAAPPPAAAIRRPPEAAAPPGAKAEAPKAKAAPQAPKAAAGKSGEREAPKGTRAAPKPRVTYSAPDPLIYDALPYAEFESRMRR